MKVSTIIYVLNGMPYFEKCIQSVIGQTLKEIEIIIIDGGSSDGTLNLIEKYGQIDPRIQIIHSAPGVGLQFNTGLKAAKGEYIAICESDDYILPNMYEKEYEIAKQNQLDFLRLNYEQFLEIDGKEILFPVQILEQTELYNKVLKPKEDSRVLEIGTNGFWSGLYRRDFLLDQELFMNESNGASYQDTTFAFLSEVKAKRVMVLNDSFYRYRLDNPNSSVNSPRKVTTLINEYNLLKMRLKRENLFETYKEQYFSWKVGGCLWFFHRVSSDIQREFARLMYQEIKVDLENEKCSGSEISEENRIIIDRVKCSFEALWKYLKYQIVLIDDMKLRLQKIDEKQNIIIFGNGNMGHIVYLYMTYIGKYVSAYIDNNEALWGKQELGTITLKPEQAISEFPGAIYLVANVNQYEVMKKQLLLYGIKKENIIVCNNYKFFFQHIFLESIIS